jgi:CRP-like cAMP-binding protein
MSAIPLHLANDLLACLSADDLDRLRPHLTHVCIKPGEVLLGEGRPVSHVYFPTTARISVLCGTAAGDSMEVAVAGSDGVIGLTFSASSNWLPGHAVTQREGEALRLPLSVLHQEIARGSLLQLLALRYTQLLMAQMAQCAVCSRLHRVDQQLCRWILMNLDRGTDDRLVVTQQQVARLLGVRREGVSSAAARLQEAGVLRWGRGRLRVIDHAGMEAHCCECYGALLRKAQGLSALMQRAA